MNTHTTANNTSLRTQRKAQAAYQQLPTPESSPKMATNKPLPNPKNATSAEPESTEPGSASAEPAHSEGFGVLHYLPLIFACLPPLGSLLLGKSEVWTDVLMLIIICWYLYQVVTVPWELYYASRARRLSEALEADQIIKDHVLGKNDTSPATMTAWQKREEAVVELRRTELISLAFTLVTPWIGSMMLHFVRPVLHDPTYINPFSVRLFMLASGVKPWTHLFSIIKRRTLYLQSHAKHEPSDLDRLSDRLTKIEADLREFKANAASKVDVRVLRDAVDAPLTDLVKAVRRHERKGELMRISAEERFDDLDAKVEEAASQASATDEILQELSAMYRTRSQKWDGLQEFITRLPLVITGVASYPRHSASPAVASPSGWLSMSFQSAAALIFLPITLPTVILRYASEKVIGSPRTQTNAQLSAASNASQSATKGNRPRKIGASTSPKA